MGLFRFNTAPGKGIDKNAPKKKGIFRYFEIFFRKFSKLFKTNMMTFLVSLPFIVVMIFLAPISTRDVMRIMDITDLEYAGRLATAFKFSVSMMFFVLLGSGPASAGYAYITRCFTREEHAWLLSDFKDKFKENFKHGIIVSLVDILYVFLAGIGFRFYVTQYAQTGDLPYLLGFCLMTTISVIFIFSHFYIYQLMVTFKQTTKQLFKNAIIVALASLPMNIVLSALTICLCFVVYLTLETILSTFIFFILGYSLLRFPIEYYAARVIEKKILPNISKNEVE
ncbi:MAG: DUF624 domain-containing protein [Clostridia bacterium]|nr:DUF624 domain-containing protein [Clostridia bacterium]